jgi:small subunit ribosomal protein S5
MPPKTDDKKRRNRRPRQQREEKEFEEYMLQLDRVTRVVKGGRRMRFRATMVIGDRAGRVGLGLGKGGDVQIAARKAATEAKKNLINVPIVNDTIPHPVKLKYKAARIMIMPAAPGTGLIAGSSIRKVLELAGIKNVMSKNIGTSNRVVIGQAMLKVLGELQMTEAAQKYVDNLKKEAAAAKKKRDAGRKENEKAGKRYPNRNRKPNNNRNAATPKTDFKHEVDKAVAEKGRLEKEIEEKK